MFNTSIKVEFSTLNPIEATNRSLFVTEARKSYTRETKSE